MALLHLLGSVRYFHQSLLLHAFKSVGQDWSCNGQPQAEAFVSSLSFQLPLKDVTFRTFANKEYQGWKFQSKFKEKQSRKSV